jgi:hypothetical protein
MVTKRKKWPKVVKGRHLTVKTHEDGHTELIWDDVALLHEVRTAISVYEAKQKSKHQEKYGARKPKE